MTTGRLYGLGIGPGDPELITLKARRVLADVDVVAYPAPLEGASLARQIAAPHLPATAAELPLHLDIGRRDRALAAAYATGAAHLAEPLAAGRDVALLCTGDPLVYGSFVYFYRRLSPTYPCTIVPGVSAVTACAAAAGVPLALGDGQLQIVPATLSAHALERALAQTQGACVVKLGRHAGKLLAVLDRTGQTERALYVAHAGFGDQAIRPAGQLDPARVPYFATVIVPPAEPEP